ncbi:unnamed protein product [Sympodiomycopsis kandeliae]
MAKVKVKSSGGAGQGNLTRACIFLLAFSFLTCSATCSPLVPRGWQGNRPPSLSSLSSLLSGLQAPFDGKQSSSKHSLDSAPETPGLHLLFHNDLDWTHTNEHLGWLLVSKRQTHSQAEKTCQDLGERLAAWPKNSVDREDLSRELAYQVYKGTLRVGDFLWTDSGRNQTRVIQLQGANGKIKHKGDLTSQDEDHEPRYKSLCTQSAKRKGANNTDTDSKWHVITRPLDQASSDNSNKARSQDRRPGKSKSKNRRPVHKTETTSVVGYRDALSFRFHAIPFANQPKRFEHSTVWTPDSNTPALIDATGTGRNRQCPQGGGTDASYSEDCLILNIWTPFLPSATSNPTSKSLKPVMVWLYGGGFNTGSGLDSTFDGGQLSSRGDVVVVTPNYRVGTLGFLPVDPNNPANSGNFGVGDCITALKWVQQHAKTFGGDPSKVTIFGQSAGGRLVEMLIGSPEAEGLFHRAILQSDPLGRLGSQPKTQEEYSAGRKSTIKSLGCDDYLDDSDALLECLREPSTEDVLDGTNFNKLVVDGEIITSNGQVFRGETGHVNDVPTIVGFMRDEEASLGSVPSAKQKNITKALKAGSVSSENIKKVIDNPDLFPTDIPHSLVNLTVEVHTDTDFRCATESLALQAVSDGHLTNGVWFYTQDQRAWQIPNYDPNGLCQPEGQGDDASAGDPSSYFFCHSGDLLPTFGTAGYEFDLQPRDDEDLIWIRNQIDQWTAFARKGDPNPASRYTKARGYNEVSGDYWPRLDEDEKIISLGPVQKVESLRQRGQQCQLLRPDLQQ